MLSVLFSTVALTSLDGAALLEITRDKKLVWRYASPAKRGDRHMMGVQLLDEKGKPLPGPALR